mmetsp:Transcript_80281/g.213064  ORF Transcript_80281/g.213064 Transcript_80281/m.213064 type:complete len:136 (-) Transcript_80281:22-429(-)|eukprot:CAMPEP_0171218772 /NCGR_PEP_ID=MMETSP0790-20130122/33372_1 /TAXON_ID=2925 /ORGANISM="Alexandrium catenella, Strain OF101" /LENGTH=135 /DNA_ID=CAMNT_0011684601 /DNA_START=95 /DNA_END=502 /DNA_ORIENTATION=+
MLPALRRLALALLVLVGSAEAGAVLDLWKQISSLVFPGPSCDKKCIARAYSLGDELVQQCDKDKNGLISPEEWAIVLETLFHSNDDEMNEREYQIFCKRVNCTPKEGIPGEKIKFVFKHEVWRKRLHDWALLSEL